MAIGNDGRYTPGNVGTSVGGGGTPALIGSYTYAELAALVAGGTLQPGGYYLLNDYVTIYDRPDYELVGMSVVPKAVIETVTAPATEPLILFAVDTNSFDAMALSTVYPNDEITYDFTYDETWVNAAPAKGKITYRKTPDGNAMNGDLRAITYKRYDRAASGLYEWYYDSGTDASTLIPFTTGLINQEQMFPQIIFTFGAPFDYLNNTINGNFNNVGCFNNTLAQGCSGCSLGSGNGGRYLFIDCEDITIYDVVGNSDGGLIIEDAFSCRIQSSYRNVDMRTATVIKTTYTKSIILASDTQHYITYFNGVAQVYTSPLT